MALNQFESPAETFAQKPLCLDELLISHPSDSYLAEMNDSNMQGIGIHNKDILVIDASLSAKDNDVVVCQLNDIVMCCVFIRSEKCIRTDNEQFYIDSDTNFQILGVVANSIRCFKPLELFEKF